MPSGTRPVYESAAGWRSFKNIEDGVGRPYAVLNNGTLTFYCDTQRASKTGTKYELNQIEDTPGWYKDRASITKVVFDPSFASARPTTTSYWFYSCNKLTEIQGLGHLNTSEVTDMFAMFYDCSQLTSLDVSKFNTAKVTDMTYMFESCSSLTRLDVSGFNTANVTSMVGMFSHCRSLASLDVSSFNTAKVTSMDHMFHFCSSLTSLDLSSFDTSSLIEKKPDGSMDSDHAINSMFGFCSSLTELTFSEKFVTKEEWKEYIAFPLPSSIKKVIFTGDLPSSMHSRFFRFVGSDYEPAILQVPSEFRDHYAAKFDGNMFYGGYFTLSGGDNPGTDNIVFADTLVKQICVSNWDTNGDDELSKTEAAAVTSFNQVFQGAEITSFDEVKYFTGVTKYDLITFAGSKLTKFTVPHFVTSINGGPNGAFANCTSLTELKVDEANAYYDSRDNCNAIIRKRDDLLLAACRTTVIPTSVKAIGNMAFAYFEHLTSVELPNSVTKIEAQAFQGCRNLSSINFGNSLASIGYYSFLFCNSLKEVILPATVTDIASGAFDCDNLSDVYSQIMVPTPINEYAFPFETATLHVPAGTKALYQQTDGWKNFQNIVEDGEPVKPMLEVEAKVLNAVDGVVYADYIYTSARWKNISDETFDGICGCNISVYKDNEWKAVPSIANTFMIESGAYSYLYGTKTYHDEDGTYKLEWWYCEDGKAEENVVATEVVEVIAHGQWKAVLMDGEEMMTYCDTDDLDFSSVDGLKAYTVGGFNTATGDALMMRVKDVPAVTGLLLVGEPDHCYLVPRCASSTYFVNMLKGVVGNWQHVDATSDGYTNYRFASKDFRAIGENGTTIREHEAYLQVPTSAAAGWNKITLRFDDTDGISGVAAETESFDVYSLSGVLVKRGATSLKKLPSGIYIVNGRKVAVR